MLGHHQHAGETPFRWPDFSGIWINSSTKKKRCQSWTPSEKLSGSAHATYAMGATRHKIRLVKKGIVLVEQCTFTIICLHRLSLIFAEKLPSTIHISQCSNSKQQTHRHRTRGGDGWTRAVIYCSGQIIALFLILSNT